MAASTQLQPTLPDSAPPGVTGPIAVTPLSGPTQNEALVLMFERLAKDPAVDVHKLRELVSMQREIIADNARAEFEASFVVMQKDLPIIDEKGEITVDGSTRSTFARHEDIVKVVRPILSAHGFGLRHQNETLPDGKLKITAILSHQNGHRETDEFICGADTSGKKNSIQAMGSTREYGRRYTTLSILNIVSRGEDDDGAKSTRSGEPDAPDEAFENWWIDLGLVADKGWTALSKALNASRADYKAFILAHRRSEWEALKARAEKVKA